MTGGREGEERARWLWRGSIAFVYAVVGIFHLALPAPFMTIMPEWVAFPRQIILITGICELVGAASILSSRFRQAAGIALALYAVCVYPANIKHAMDSLAAGSNATLGWWYHAPRLAFQPVFVWWALYAGGLIDWPFRKRTHTARDKFAD